MHWILRVSLQGSKFGDILIIMCLARHIITMLIVLGLAMPTVRTTVWAAPAAAMEDCEGMEALSADECPCCDTAAKCPANMCAIKCLKTVGSVALATGIHRRLSSAKAHADSDVRLGMSEPPPAPPPRA